jgi:Ca2+-transporting ATPase
MFQQGNRAYQGTLVRTGTAIGVVVATGTRTELGKINAELKQPEPEIPLHRHIATLAKQILGIAFVLGILLMAVGLHRGEPVGELVATAVALAISVVPEGLPIVLTYVLATGVTRMSQRQVLVKKLQAVESLGQAQILAVDKTGTITRNELAVTRIWLAGKQYDVEADGFHPHGAVTHKGKKGAALLHHLSWVARSSALTATAKITAQDDGTWDVAGEPTEAALSVFAQKTGVVREEIETYYELLEDTGFDYTSKVRLVLHKFHKQYLVTVAGAPEAIAEVADLTADEREAFLQAQQQMAQEGLRTVAVAHQVFSRKPQLQLAHHRFRLDGLLGMRDTLRPGVSEAVAALAATGIKVVMITGDHAATAEALARTADIFHDGDHVMTGVELERLSEGELAEAVKNVTVFARVTPEHKLRIVQAFRAAGKTIAMTGDGVNDAPSLVAADLGISMGQRGTDVAKEASDLVLLDDNMGSIVAAVEEGRAIYARIQRVVRYLLTGSMSQVLLISLALFFVLPLPLLPSQIIWLNMVTDAFMVLGVAQDRDRAGLLGKDYVHPRTILTAAMLRQVLTLGVPIALGTLAAYLVALQGGDIVVARTVALTTLATAHWLAAWLIGGGVTSNRTLAGLTVVALGLQLAVLYLEPLQRLFHTAPLAAGHWLLIGGVLVVIWAVEMVRRLLHKLVG